MVVGLLANACVFANLILLGIYIADNSEFTTNTKRNN